MHNLSFVPVRFFKLISFARLHIRPETFRIKNFLQLCCIDKKKRVTRLDYINLISILIFQYFSGNKQKTTRFRLHPLTLRREFFSDGKLSILKTF